MPYWRSRRRVRVLLLAAATAFVVPMAAPAPVQAATGCATPGRDGTATLSGVINTYYPGSSTAGAGSATITLGAATGAATPIAIGDLVLVIQMQDAAIDSTNTGAYGDGVAGDPATGWTALNSAGLYEYAVATSAVPLAGGSLTVSTPLINTYTQAAPTATQGQRDYQVIRVPQYVAATLTSGLTAGAFNGSTGGVLVFDVDGALNLNGATVSVGQGGFRGGLGRQLGGGAGGTATDYRNLSANLFHGQKGEGIAGTPQYTYNSLSGTTANSGVDGYPNGSTARGAPGTAGGGGTDPNPTANDQNTGGGGGANGGAGGMGGNSWNTNLARGGFGGTAFPATAARVTAGAGGGAGTRNNSDTIANASSGGSGGGIVMIRTGSIAGAGTVGADGGTGVVPANDGGGGGGAGGSIVLVTQTGGLAGLTANARGGAGANAWPTSAGGGGANYHGPGGGGGGGVVLTTSAPTAVTVTGGVDGTTTTDLAPYGATPGAGGTSALITASQIPGAGSGASCTSDLTIAKSHTDPFVRGSTGTYGLTASNIGGTATSGTSTVTDSLPAGLTPTAASGTGWSCAIVAQTVTCTSTAVVASNGSFPPISITVTVAQSAAASVTNTATVSGGGEINTANDTASDPTNVVSRADIAVAKIASSGTVTVGSNVNFTITVTNNGPSDATGVQVTDQLPAGLTFVAATPSQGTYTSGTGVWDIGAIASGAAVTLTLTATVTTTGPLTNTARKTAENETDPNPSNDSAGVTINGQAPDMTIAKSHVGSFVRGSTGSYSVTVSNIGPVASSGLVTVSDTLPAGLAATVASGIGWTCGIAGQTVICTRSDALAAGASYPVITITVSVSQSVGSAVTNTAAVGGGNEVNTSNNIANDPTTITSVADVGVAKNASAATVTVGSNVTFTITATNNGPSNATGLQVTDQLPAGLTFVSATPSQGTYTSGTGVWNLGALASGTSATLSLVATVTTTGGVTNTARKTAGNELDPNPGNDVSSATVTGTGLPGPPNGGMAPIAHLFPSPSGGGQGGGLLIVAALALITGLLFLGRRSRRVAIAAGLVAFASFTTVVAPEPNFPSPITREGRVLRNQLTSSQLADLHQFGKLISTAKPEIGERVTILHPAPGPVTPYRLRIPALDIDSLIEPVGVTARGLMDVPGNLWEAAWLKTSVRPGALGQAVIDGHLDSVNGSAVFTDLHRLKPGDRIYVSDTGGNEVTFAVTALLVEPLDGFNTLRVFGPAHGRFLNLITCAGRFDPTRRTYDHRLVVFAQLV